ncbi:uncharacterized protein lrriq1 isoform X2 [Boleophthalmus pectinirostris]|uniref:uncharacterized protein lrriq1 isoform X2 n=1 Tax=Boleophthalmus pectinirostris TaxID=150288 RepID=UPI0024308DC4|nr:uncharacterized protein lrriq1 isoform X2 [Boleophthalmus pectinirostris]
MTEADPTNTTLYFDEESDRTETFYDEEAADEVPASLLRYFETSRSRAVLCERLILGHVDHEDEDEVFTELDCITDKDLDSQHQRQINSFIIPNNTGSSPSSHSPHSEEADSPDIKEVSGKHLTEEEQRMEEQSKGFKMERMRREEEEREEERRQIEKDFELELRRLQEAERVQQAQLELEAQRAQHRLEQEMFLQQEMLKSLKQRVEEESKRRFEEQAKFKLELQRRQEDRRQTELQQNTAIQIQTETFNSQIMYDDQGQTHGEKLHSITAKIDSLLTEDRINLECLKDTKSSIERQSIHKMVQNSNCASLTNLRPDLLCKNVNIGKVMNHEIKQAGAEVRKVPEVDKEQGFQLMQKNAVEFQNKIPNDCENNIGKHKAKCEEEEKVNCDEDQISFCKDENTRETEIKSQNGSNLVLHRNEKAMNRKQNTTEISCNFPPNSSKLKTNDGACDVKENTEEMSSKNEISLNASPNEPRIVQGRFSRSFVNTNTGEEEHSAINVSSIPLQHAFDTSLETIQNGCKNTTTSSTKQCYIMSSINALLNASTACQETPTNNCNSDKNQATTLKAEDRGDASLTNHTSADKLGNTSSNLQDNICGQNMIDKKDKNNEVNEVMVITDPSTQDSRSKSSNTVSNSTISPTSHNSSKNKSNEREETLHKMNIENDKFLNSVEDDTFTKTSNCEQTEFTKRQDTRQYADNTTPTNNCGENLKYDRKEDGCKMTNPSSNNRQNEPNARGQGNYNFSMQSCTSDLGNYKAKFSTISSSCDLGNEEADQKCNSKTTEEMDILKLVDEEGAQHARRNKDMFNFYNCQENTGEIVLIQTANTDADATKTKYDKNEVTQGKCCKNLSQSVSEQFTISNDIRKPSDLDTDQTILKSVFLDNVATENQKTTINKDNVSQSVHEDITFINQATTSFDSVQKAKPQHFGQDGGKVYCNKRLSSTQGGSTKKSVSLTNVVSSYLRQVKVKNNITVTSMDSQNLSDKIEVPVQDSRKENSNTVAILTTRTANKDNVPPSSSDFDTVFECSKDTMQHGNKNHNMDSMLGTYGENDISKKNSSQNSSETGANKDLSQFVERANSMKDQNYKNKTTPNSVNIDNQIDTEEDIKKKDLVETIDSDLQNLMAGAETSKHNSKKVAILKAVAEGESTTPVNYDAASVYEINQDNTDNVSTISGAIFSIEDGKGSQNNRLSQNRQAVSSETFASKLMLMEDSGWSGLCLPEETEQKRLKWMRECLPWSRLRAQTKRTIPGEMSRGPKRAAAAGIDHLPPLPPQTLLQNTGLTELTRLTTVHLEDLSSYNLSSLSSCPCLRSLTLRRCGLKALEHLNYLHRLCYVDVQENQVSRVDLENMKSLRVLRLGHNFLRSTRGLSGAVNLSVLDLSHNHITRIGGLESLMRLQTLSFRQNQLTSSSGLSALTSLMHLDLSCNHLNSVEGLDQCALLWSLDLRGNNLTQPPDLKNQVLLRDLHLDDNSLSSLHTLTQNWFPMIHQLTVAQNSLTELPSLSSLVSLQTLDLRFNCLSELSTVAESLRGCLFIRDISVEGNPLQQEPHWRSILQKSVLGLRTIDGLPTDSAPNPCSRPDPGSSSGLSPGLSSGLSPGLSLGPGPRLSVVSGTFFFLCQNQHHQSRELQARHRLEISATSSPLEELEICCRHLDEEFHLAQEQRLEHEYGEMSPVQERGEEGVAEEQGGEMEVQTEEESTEKHPLFLQPKNKGAAMRQKWTAPPADTEERERAAVVIQACWRGFRLRRRLRHALAETQSFDTGWDEGLEPLDLEEFVMDQVSLDGDWSLGF